jgi:hypothetical protein
LQGKLGEASDITSGYVQSNLPMRGRLVELSQYAADSKTQGELSSTMTVTVTLPRDTYNKFKLLVSEQRINGKRASMQAILLGMISEAIRKRSMG